MHPVLLSAFITMQPRLQATEYLQAAQVIGVGTGSMKKRVSRGLLNQWNRQTGISQRIKSGKPGSQELESAMAGVGIKVVIVSAKENIHA